MRISCRMARPEERRSGAGTELAAADLAFSCAPDGQLRMTLGNRCSWRSVRLVRCFPVSDPDRHILVRCALSGEDAEIGTIADLRGLCAGDRDAVDRHLSASCLLPTVRRVLGLRQEFGFLYWETETDRGTREFATRDSQDALIRLRSGALLATATDDCRYLLPPPEKLDRASLALLGRFVFV